MGKGNPVALVTGGGSGIGAACCRMLARRGYTVVVGDRQLDDAKAVAADVGGDAVATYVDVADEDAVQAMVATCVNQFGRMDVAVNNAGVGVPEPTTVADMSFSEWRRITAINLDGVFLSMHYEIPAMLASGGGSIVNMSSILGAAGQAGAGPYVSAKHGVIGLTKAAALEYAESGIRVNAVGPGYVDTPLLARRSAEHREQLARRHPVGRLATADEVAELVGYLVSPGAAFTTGTYIPVDGGYLAQ